VSVFPAKLVNPSVTLGGQRTTFPCEMETGSYLEYRGPADCKLYGPQGQLLAEVQPIGEAPTLATGDNEASFACEGPEGITRRAQVTVIAQGEPLDG
jgi:hypothetical protein